MRYISFFVFFFLYVFSADAFTGITFNGRNLISPRELSEIPDKISRRFSGSAEYPLKVYAIDMDNDGSDDYIIRAYMNGQNQTGMPYCFFVTNNMVLKFWQRLDAEFLGWQDNWFVRLDEGMLYMIERSHLNGWALYRFNNKIWDPKFILVFNPVLQNGEKKELLGIMTAGKVRDIWLKKEGKSIKIRADFIAPSGEIAKKRNPGPFIYFLGDIPPESFYEEQFFTVEELLKKNRK